MAIVEFTGIARSGKSSTAKYLEDNFPGVVYYPERHDLVPEEIKGDDFAYHLWYAKYCVDKLNEISSKPGIHLFERGVIDHIVMGKTYHKMDWFSDHQLEEYMVLLSPYIDRIDLTFVFKIPVNVSVQRAKDQGKDVTKAVPYLSTLYELYGEVKTWLPDAIYLPENSTLGELAQLTSQDIKKMI